MQPQEPVPGAAPQAPAAPAVPVGQKPPNRRKRLVLAMLGGVMALLCLGLGGVVVSLYSEATKIKRTAPDAVVDNFLGAYLANRDDNEAALYECKSGADFSQIQAFRSDVEQREKKHSVGIAVTWSSLGVAVQGSRGVVTAELTRTISDQSGRDSSSWRFEVVDQDGWRVCGATKVPQ